MQIPNSRRRFLAGLSASCRRRLRRIGATGIGRAATGNHHRPSAVVGW